MCSLFLDKIDSICILGRDLDFLPTEIDLDLDFEEMVGLLILVFLFRYFYKSTELLSLRALVLPVWTFLEVRV